MRTLLACLLAFGLAAGAWADQKDQRLPALFDRLKGASSNDAARDLEGQIWDIWLEAGDPALDKLMARGTVAMQLGNYQAALAAFERIVKQRPDFAEGWNKRATLYYLMGDYKKSLADIDRTLKLEPRHFGALSGLGLVNLQLERYEEAAKAYRRVLAIDPRNESARHDLEAIEELIRKKSI